MTQFAQMMETNKDKPRHNGKLEDSNLPQLYLTIHFFFFFVIPLTCTQPEFIKTNDLIIGFQLLTECFYVPIGPHFGGEF